jgi:hypothetical protein
MMFKYRVTLILASVTIAPLVIAQNEQWLQYRWAGDADRIVGDLGVVRSEVTAEKPKGVRLPDFKCEGPFFAFWSTPMIAGGGVWMAFDRKSRYGPHDLLYIDLNGNGSLADEYALEAYRPSDNVARFAAVRIVFDDEDGPITYHYNVQFYRYPDRTFTELWSAGWYEGTIIVGGVKKQCILIDHNANGTFNDKSPDPAQCDRIRIGEKDDQNIRFVGNYIEFNGVLYRSEIARDGAYIKLTEAENVKFGNVRLTGSITEFSAGGENGLFTLEPEKGLASLPIGKYRIYAWAIERKDKNGEEWTLEAREPSEGGAFEVTEGVETFVEVGEPVFARLEGKKSGGNYEFEKDVRGRFGESIRLTCNGQNMGYMWKMIARNREGTFERTYPIPDQ